MFDSKKKVKLTNAEGVEYKLAKKQLQAIDLNKALLAMYTNQVRLELKSCCDSDEDGTVTAYFPDFKI